MNNLIDLVIPVSLGIIMFGIGLNLCFKDFKRVFSRPRAILTGLGGQMILMPLIAFALVYFWPMDPIHKAGFILIASCPGGTTSNLVTYLLKGRVALSVSITAFNSILIVFTIPFIVNLGTDIFLDRSQGIVLSFWDIFREMMLTVIVPVVAGITFNETTAGHIFNERIKKTLKYILPAALLLIFVIGALAESGGKQFDFKEDLHLFLPAFIFNASVMVTGYAYARKLKLRHRDAYTVSIEMGLQNSALGIFIATSILGEEKMAMVALIYGSFTFISTWVIGYLLKRRLPVGRGYAENEGY